MKIKKRFRSLILVLSCLLLAPMNVYVMASDKIELGDKNIIATDYKNVRIFPRQQHDYIL